MCAPGIFSGRTPLTSAIPSAIQELPALGNGRDSLAFLLQFELTDLLFCCVLCRDGFGVDLAKTGAILLMCLEAAQGDDKSGSKVLDNCPRVACCTRAWQTLLLGAV